MMFVSTKPIAQGLVLRRLRLATNESKLLLNPSMFKHMNVLQMVFLPELFSLCVEALNSLVSKLVHLSRISETASRVSVSSSEAWSNFSSSHKLFKISLYGLYLRDDKCGSQRNFPV